MTDREWAITWIEAIKEKYIHGGDESYDDCRRRSIDMAIEALKQPEIVRCKDCKWWDKKDGANYGYCHACKHGYYSDHWEIGIYRTYVGDWFCADGVRKDESTD